MSIPRRLAIAAILLLLALPALALAPDAIHLQGETLTVGQALPAERLAVTADDGLWLVHLDHVPGAADRARLTRAGAEILAYLPVNAYLLHLPGADASGVSALPGVDLLTPYRADWRIAPRLPEQARGAESILLTLSFRPGVDLGALVARVGELGEPLRSSDRGPRPRLWLQAAPSALPALAGLPGLLWIEPAGIITERNDTATWIVQSAEFEQTPIWDRGLSGQGQVIGHIDSDFDPDNCFFADPDATPIGPNHRKVIFMGEYEGSGSTHGPHTAGTAAGWAAPVDPAFGDSLRGHAYAAKIAHSSYRSTGYDLYTDLQLHHDVGARVHTNSWGNDATTAYTELCVDIDAFATDNEEALLLWACTNTATLKTPENAKNALAVGASYTWQFPDFHAVYRGGIGPTEDGRRKPELYVPGRAIRSAAAWQLCSGTVKSGTSMACPAAAGAAAAVREYLTAGWWPSGNPRAEDAVTPSGALLKALLLNSTLPMDSIPDGYPNDLEGWGRMVLNEGLFFAGDSRELWFDDVRNAQGLETSDEFYYSFEVKSAAEPLAVSLVFTDRPGEPASLTPVVNDLDLELSGPDGTFLGNVFDVELGLSVAGGEQDALNNVERVLLAAPTPGFWTLRIHAAAVPMGPQGYALAIRGDLGERVESFPPDPSFVMLDQNYPNPFVAGAGTRGGTTLRLSLRAAQRGSLSIYDVAGRRIRKLVENVPLEFGVNEFSWDGEDDAGEPAASGIYFARLHTDSGAESRSVRIVLLR